MAVEKFVAEAPRRACAAEGSRKSFDCVGSERTLPDPFRMTALARLSTEPDEVPEHFTSFAATLRSSGGCFQRFEQLFGILNGRQAGAVSADERPSVAAFGLWDRKQSFGQRGGEGVGSELAGFEADDGLVDGKAGRGDGFESGGICVVRSSLLCLRFLPCQTDDDDLHGSEDEVVERQGVAAGVEAEVLDDPGEGAEGFFGDPAVVLAAGECFEAQMRRLDCRRG
jgi:hypothetical protein